jgi:hypothetical protein
MNVTNATMPTSATPSGKRAKPRTRKKVDTGAHSTAIARVAAGIAKGAGNPDRSGRRRVY